MAISQRERKLIEEAKRLLEDCFDVEEHPEETKKDVQNRIGSRRLLRRLRKMSGV